jgi:hypothetical protein
MCRLIDGKKVVEKKIGQTNECPFISIYLFFSFLYIHDIVNFMKYITIKTKTKKKSCIVYINW